MGERQAEGIRAKLHMHGQAHVLKYWDELSDASRRKLNAQLAGFDLELLERLAAENLGEDRKAGAKPPALEEVSEPEVVTLPKTPEGEARREEAGEKGSGAIRAGRVACLIVAGGQGSRLGYDGPKGCYPVGPVTDRPLFRLHFEKVLAASRRAGRPVPLYIMTSETNDRATREFLREHGQYGLDPEDVYIFRQGMMPAVTPEGEMILQARDRVFAAPNGHGGTFKALADSGALDDMTARGIEDVYYFQVDNPMLPVPDPVFIGFHVETGSAMSSKVLRKRSPDEPIGTVVRRMDEGQGHVEVIEYSDIPPGIRDARGPNGEVRFPWGSIAVHAISVGFIRRFSEGGERLPFHRAKKEIPFLDERGRTVEPDEPNGVKFEMFVFDAIPLAERAMLMEVDRADEFAPVKNAAGEDSIVTARRALTEQYAKWLEAAGVAVAREADGTVAGALEIGPLTADSAEALVEALKGGRLPPDVEFRDGLVI